MDDMIVTLVKEISRIQLEEFQRDFLTWRWCLLLFLLIVPWIVFWVKAKRELLPATLLLGAWVTLLSETFDHLGYELGAWSYTVELLPLFPRFEEVNFSTLPVTYMLIYQYYPGWKQYTIALAIMSGVFTIVCEPLLVYLGIYKTLSWKIYYGFPIYIAIGMVCKWLLHKVYAAARKAQT